MHPNYALPAAIGVDIDVDFDNEIEGGGSEIIGTLPSTHTSLLTLDFLILMLFRLKSSVKDLQPGTKFLSTSDTPIG
jgi:hypothetical protein